MGSLWLNTTYPLNIAHQGASAVAPPNTLSAFEKAIALGAHGVELDVHLSADGVPVVIHDFTVDRTTDGQGRVADLPLATLKALDAGSWFDPAFAGERIPTLEEVFAAVGQQLLVNVELKVPPREDRGLEKAVVEQVARHGMSNRVLISSFNPYALRRTRCLDPRIPLGLLYNTALLSRLARAIATLMPDLQPEAIHPHWALVRPSNVRQAHARGRRVMVWTVDEPTAVERLIGWGVDGVITNRPDRMREVLEKRRSEPSPAG